MPHADSESRGALSPIAGRVRSVPVLRFLAVSMLAGCLAAPMPAVPAGQKVTDLAAEVLREVNVRRGAHGLAPLEPDARLTSAARAHAADLARSGRLSHTGSDGSNIGRRIGQEGYRGCLMAENIARGHPDAAAVVQGWMDSPPHRRNILRNGVTQFGAAHATGRIWVLVLARPC